MTDGDESGFLLRRAKLLVGRRRRYVVGLADQRAPESVFLRKLSRASSSTLPRQSDPLSPITLNT